MEKDPDYFTAKYNGYRQKMVEAILRDVAILGDRPLMGTDALNVTKSELALILNKHL